MGIIRWLYGRSSLNRIDAPVLILIVLSGMPFWAIIWAAIVWLIVSASIEIALFGEGYHERSNICQEVAEGWDDVPDNP